METTTHTPRTLTDAEARALLEREHVGRLAFLRQGVVDVEPITYTWSDGWIFGRTSAGTKLSSLTREPRCAFEVDTVSSPFNWSSVVVRGTFYLLDPETGSSSLHDRALHSVRALMPEAFTAADPHPERSLLFGMSANVVTGRSSD